MLEVVLAAQIPGTFTLSKEPWSEGTLDPASGLGRALGIYLLGHCLSASVSAAGGLHSQKDFSLNFKLLSRYVYGHHLATASIPESPRVALRGQIFKPYIRPQL